MFQVLENNHEKHNIILSIAKLLFFLESIIKLFPHKLSLEFIFNISNNIILNIILCSLYYFTNCTAFIELYTHLFIYTNIYKIIFSNEKIDPCINIFFVYYLNYINCIFYLSQLGYIFQYIKELNKYSNKINIEYYTYHQLYLFLFKFLPLCYLFYNSNYIIIVYLILIVIKILNI